ncbi:MAG: hypothetical protein HN802_05995 [Candidatus Jacksonbacteria bacterium]|jgi:hypothetical protein|nr:hypothetical protein [Candidatus Jacksonbacteria bacterium]MBT6034121.1 hypothetical protein [Candidatus Jacksonbacteria bacterium]MBT6757800.1 hypothetical protein [Candidatus Jacksonbacteria bacterium]MBT6955361.1 hypothetical protein [Candidatus Jacksonbacteria bacterium]MBT7008695.1 hypothetical protein [Candidatus Jacksonbacteria bacterium]
MLSLTKSKRFWRLIIVVVVGIIANAVVIYAYNIDDGVDVTTAVIVRALKSPSKDVKAAQDQLKRLNTQQ